MVNQYSSKCNNLITTSAQCLESVFVCGSACTGEQFATYLPPVITQEVSVRMLETKYSLESNYLKSHLPTQTYSVTRILIIFLLFPVACNHQNALQPKQPIVHSLFFFSISDFQKSALRDIFVSDPLQHIRVCEIRLISPKSAACLTFQINFKGEYVIEVT